MHVQREQIDDVNRRAHASGNLNVLGGPSVSGCPEWYPDVDFLHHVGELGDATVAIFARLDESVARPRQEMRFVTNDRTPLGRFPVPAYHLVNLRQYVLASVRFSSGYPTRCEFCDMPEVNEPRALYRRFQHQIQQTDSKPVRFAAVSQRDVPRYRRGRFDSGAAGTANRRSLPGWWRTIIHFARDCRSGIGEYSFYAGSQKAAPVSAEASAAETLLENSLR